MFPFESIRGLGTLEERVREPHKITLFAPARELLSQGREHEEDDQEILQATVAAETFSRETVPQVPRSAPLVHGRRVVMEGTLHAHYPRSPSRSLLGLSFVGRDRRRFSQMFLCVCVCDY